MESAQVPRMNNFFAEHSEAFFQMLMCAGAAFIASLFWSLQKIKNGYKEQTKLQVFGNIVFKALSATVLSVTIVLLLPLEIKGLDITLTTELKLGISMFMAIFGQGVLDVFLRKKFGLSIYDLENAADRQHVQERLSKQGVQNDIQGNNTEGSGDSISKP